VRIVRLVAVVALAAATGGSSATAVRAADAPTASLDAVARAEGNRRAEAIRLGDVLFRRVWPAQIMKVRVDGMGPHAVSGLVLSGVKFHTPLGPDGFANEVVALVRETFAASAVEEVDVWATVPLPTVPHEVVTGDRAMPTSRVVFSVTVPRVEAATFAERIRRGDGVFWDPEWRGTLAKR
jgi:hypothetical protein